MQTKYIQTKYQRDKIKILLKYTDRICLDSNTQRKEQNDWLSMQTDYIQTEIKKRNTEIIVEAYRENMY